MMALFIVLWILSSNDKVKEAVSSYFKDPIGFSNKSKVIIESKTAPPKPAESKVQEEMNKKEAEKVELQKMGQKIEQELRTDTQFLGLADQVRIEVVKEGLKIELIDSENDVFFDLGTSELKMKAKKLIEKIGFEISKLPNKIIVEGHTDAHQFMNKGTGYTNFELSSERALVAKRELVKGGLLENQIDEIRGYADTRLRDPSDPLSYVNRRISITLKYLTQ